MKRKLLAWLLAAVMTFGLLPVSALAEGVRAIDLSGIIGLFARSGGDGGENVTPVRSTTDDYYYDVGDNAYHIATAEGWDAFCNSLEVDSNNGFYRQTVKLNADIGSAEAPITRMAGNDSYLFKGTFDGGNHTMTVAISVSSGSAAPFYSIDGATIKYLKVAGSVTGQRHSAGLVSRTNGASTIQNCVVSTSVTALNTDDGYIGGIVGHGKSSNPLTLTGCVFNGSLKSDSNYVGGLVGWADSFKLNMTDCLFAGSVSAAANGFHPVYCRFTAADYTHSGVFYTVMPTVNNADKADVNTGVCVYPNSTAPSRLGNAGTDYGFMLMYENGVKLGDTYYCIADPADFSVDNDGAYHIYTEEGWNVFCGCLDNNLDYNRFCGKTVCLENDISVTRPAGYSYHDFCGTFDGKKNTLTFTYDCSEPGANAGVVAPFGYVSADKANPSDSESTPSRIKDLNVVCNINSDKEFTSGLIGHAYGIVNIENCTVSGTIAVSAKYAGGFLGQNNCASAPNKVSIKGCVSSVTIISSVSNKDDNDGSHGGFIGECNTSNARTYIEDCVFNGKLISANSQNATSNCAGFIGWNQGNTISIKNCVYAPAWDDSKIISGATFLRGVTTNALTNCWYTETLGDAQGRQAYRLTKGEGIESIEAYVDGETTASYDNSGISVHGERAALSDVFYFAQGDSVSLTLSHVPAGVNYQFLAYSVSAGCISGSGNDYSLVMPNEDVTVTAEFSKLPLTYIGRNGETVTVPASDYDFLTSGMTTLTTGTYAVSGSLTLENRITVSGDVLLVLMDNCDVEPKKGISVNEGNSLTIAAQSTSSSTMGRIQIWNYSMNSNNAAIGGDNGCSCGSITVYGGRLTVYGGLFAAGIGGGYNGSGGSIAIYGGEVYAVGGDHAAGIGGGGNGGFDSIVIAGGKVTSRTLFGAGSNFTGTPGTISLGWTNADDYIDIRSSVNGSVSFSRLMKIEGETDYLADGADVGNKKLVPYTDGYIVVFHENGGEGEMNSQFFAINASQALTANAFTRTGYGFMGWATSADGGVVYTDEQSITTNITDRAGGIVHLYAVWQIDVFYLNENGETVPVPGNGYTLLTSDVTELENGKVYAVSGELTVNSRITVSGSVTLVLMNNCTFNANRGITVSANNSLTIYAQSTSESTMGRLNAKLDLNNDDDDYNAGIGGSNGPAGTITVVGGYLDVEGGYCGAGIGGGNGGDGGNITIYGGKVVTKSIAYGAGIGGGSEGSGGTIIISGGSVSAYGYGGAGIGGGFNNVDIQTIEITGGTVYAQSSDGAGIGGGSGENSMKSTDGFGNGGNISISGGTVTAVNNERGAAIGGGYHGGYFNISISGGKVTANALDSQGSAIGNGYNIDYNSGSLSFGWTDPDDFIDIKGTVSGTVSFDRLMKFENGTEFLADGANVNNNKLVPYTGCIVVFDANGGAGEMANQTFAWDEAQNLAANAFTRTGYHFSGWALTSNGEVAYQDMELINSFASVSGSTIDLYAVWQANQYTVVFHKNDGSDATADQSFTYGQQQNLNTGVFTRTNYSLVGWSSTSNGGVEYTNGQSVSNLTSVNGGTFDLYAVWNETTFTITLSGDVSGLIYAPAVASPGDTVTVFVPPCCTGSISVAMNSNGSGVALDGLTFIMPEDSVTISGSIVKPSVNYLNHLGETVTLNPDEYSLLLPGMTELSSGTYAVSGDVTVDTRINVTGDVTLVLMNGCTFTAHKGITVSKNGSVIMSLTICAQSEDEDTMGELIIDDVDENNAGIGGSSEYKFCGIITVCGGKLTVTGGKKAAGIGGGYDGNAANGITVYGGILNVTGGSRGAGIGTGYIYGGNRTARITIYGGKITARGGTDGAGIGGGEYGHGIITIHGGDITATGNDHGAGIGSGYRGYDNVITITGGKVDARVDTQYPVFPAAIGGGYKGGFTSIAITGGQVTVGTRLGAGDDTVDERIGTISFGWTDPADYIDIQGIVKGYTTVARPMGYEGETGIVEAGDYGLETDSLANKKLVPAPHSTVVFHANDGTDVTVIRYFAVGETQSLPTNLSVREGYKFKGWAESADGAVEYAEGAEGNFNTEEGGTVDLYAVWQDMFGMASGADGSNANPYIISSAEGWDFFCDCLGDNEHYNRFGDKTIRLDENISVSRPAGYSAHDFCGIFNGNKHTLTFTYDDTDASAVDYVAPFSFVSNDDSGHPMLIKNLNVVCNITTHGKYTSGLIGSAWSNVNVENCSVSGTITTSNKNAAGFIGQNNCGGSAKASIKGCVCSVTIISSVSNDGSHGGFIAECNLRVSTNIEDCVFNGKLITTNDNTPTTDCAGFIGFNGGSTASLKNCVYAPAAAEDGETAIASGATFFRGNTPGTFTGCWYTDTLGSEQGYKARTVNAGEGVESLTVSPVGNAVSYDNSGIEVYGLCVRYNGVLYYGNGASVSLTLSHSSPVEGYDFAGYTVDYGTLTQSGDTYILVMPDYDVTVMADFTELTLTYIGENGEVTLDYGQYIVLTDAMTTLANGTYAVSGELTVNTRITVSGSVTLVLTDGCKFNAKKGITVSQNGEDVNSLTICAQSTDKDTMGKLIVDGIGDFEDEIAGIGGSAEYPASGLITVVGGNLDVKAGYYSYGAGIGAGKNGGCGRIKISGGFVNAESAYGAGIGGGSCGTGCTVIITGGEVSASSREGAGIGTGDGSKGGEITIEGGNVMAETNSGAGIGSGNSSSGVSITISGGTVSAASRMQGAGIGCGERSGFTKIEILGGKVSASAGSGSAIGCGANSDPSESPIKFGWTDPDDFIDITGTVSGSVSFEDPMRKAIERQSLANGASVNNSKLVPYIAYTVVFHANDGTETTETKNYLYGMDKKLDSLASLGFTSGQAFLGWNTNAEGTGLAYPDEAAIVSITGYQSGTVHLYAMWGAEGAPELSFAEVTIRPKDTDDEKKDLRFKFSITLNSTRVLVGSRYFGPDQAAYELNALKVRYKKGENGVWSNSYLPINNLFEVSNTEITFTVVFVNLTDPGLMCYLAARFGYSSEGGANVFHQGVAVGACVETVNNANSPEHPVFPPEPSGN